MPLEPPEEGLFASKQELIDYCKCHGISQGYAITHLFTAHPDAIQQSRVYCNIILMDCTYKTNRFKLPLLNVVSITNLNTTYTTKLSE
jgi:hypothetical protein